MLEGWRRRVGAIVALAMVISTTACLSAQDPAPSPRASPGEPAYVPPLEEACNFLLGVGGQDFAAFSGDDLSGMKVVRGIDEVLGSPDDDLRARIVERGGLVCVLDPPRAGEFVSFGWAPITEAEREQIIDEIEAQGYERRESEGGTEFTRSGAETPDTHLVTNAGWYHSSQERGAVYLRTLFED